MFDFFLTFIPRAIIQGTPLLYGSTGETLTEKSGNLNLGIPGIMYVGAISGVIGAFYYESSLPGPEAFSGALAVAITLGATLLGSLLMGLPDRYASRKPERYGSGHDHFRRRVRQLLRGKPD